MSANGIIKKTMRAVVWEGKVGSVAVRDVPRPTIQLPEDAIVRVTTAGLCGSDLHTYHGTLGSSEPPWTMGHEAVGVIDEVGSATEQFKVGDRVLIPCGHDLGHYTVDSRVDPLLATYGYGKDFGDLGGCQAEYVRVPYADDSLVRINNEYSSDLDWLFLTDIFSTGWTGLDFSGFEAGDKVVIFGAGPVGLMCAYAAKLRGASQVYSVDLVRERLDKAASIGAIPIDFTSEEGIASVQILRREPQGVKRIVDCVGQGCLNERLKPQQNYIIREALTIASVNGGIGLAGVYATLPKSEGAPNADHMDPELLVGIPQLWTKRLSIYGGSIEEHMFELLPRLVDLVETGKVQLDFVISAQMSIEDAPLAYERFNKRLETKVVFRFPGSKPHAEENGLPEKKETRASKLPLHKGRPSFRGLN